MPSPLGILCAIRPELELLRSLLADDAATDVAGRPATTGRLDGVEVVLVEAGVGKVNTALAAGLMVERFGCRGLLFSGVGGGLDPSLDIGDVVIAERTIQHDAGVLGESGLTRYQAGHVPFFNPTAELGYRPSDQLLGRVRACLDQLDLEPFDLGRGGPRVPRVVLGTILTGDQFLDSESAREELYRRLGGAAVEMEGAALAQAAAALGVDHLVLRCLSDLAGAGSPTDFTRFLPAVAEISVRVLRHLLPAF